MYGLASLCTGRSEPKALAAAPRRAVPSWQGNSLSPSRDKAGRATENTSGQGSYRRLRPSPRHTPEGRSLPASPSSNPELQAPSSQPQLKLVPTDLYPVELGPSGSGRIWAKGLGKGRKGEGKHFLLEEPDGENELPAINPLPGNSSLVSESTTFFIPSANK